MRKFSLVTQSLYLSCVEELLMLACFVMTWYLECVLIKHKMLQDATLIYIGTLFSSSCKNTVLTVMWAILFSRHDIQYGLVFLVLNHG